MTTTGERQSFLDAIRADSDADAPRLVYADWLDECGEDLRAGLIRYQVAGGPPIPVRRLSCPDLLPTDLCARSGLTLERGFVDEISLGRSDRPAALDQLLADEAVPRVICPQLRFDPSA